VPICISKPSAVRALGTAITPALLTSTSIGPDASANARTDARSARSNRETLTSPVIRAAAVSPLETVRQASTTRAPFVAKAAAVAAPRPELAPVTTMVRPVWSGISATVQDMGAAY